MMKKEEIVKMFDECCEKLGIEQKDEIKNLAIYELTDGTRTSMDVSGPEAYIEGGIFIMRLFHILSCLGVKHSYVLTTGESHTQRDNYDDIIEALTRQVGMYSEFAKKNNIRLKFFGNLYLLSKNFMNELRELEDDTKNNTGFTSYILINYSSDRALAASEYADFPNANVVIKHTKGQVNDGLWLPGKMPNNSFVYAQNASVSRTWSDKQLVYLVCVALRSMIFHKNKQYSKSYGKNEIDYYKQKREKEMTFIHKKLESSWNKRVVMFSDVGPEIYEF